MSANGAFKSESNGIVIVAEVMREIRNQICSTGVRRADYARKLERSKILLPEFTRMESLLATVRVSALQVGSMPPMPNTIRGRVGAKLVALVRRCLFWYTPQLHGFHLALSAALTAQADANRSLLDNLQETQKQLAEIKLALAATVVELQPETPADSTAPKGHGWTD